MWAFATMAENGEEACLGQDRKSPSTALFSLAEEGCLRLMPASNPCPVDRVVYHKSLNVLLAFSQDGRASVVDIASGTVLHDTKALLSTSNKSSGIFYPLIFCCFHIIQVCCFIFLQIRSSAYRYQTVEHLSWHKRDCWV